MPRSLLRYPAMFSAPQFRRLQIHRTRYFVPADVMRDPAELERARAFVVAARAAGVSVLLHVSSADLRPSKGRIVSAQHLSRGRRRARRLLPRARREGLRRLERGQPRGAGD